MQYSMLCENKEELEVVRMYEKVVEGVCVALPHPDGDNRKIWRN
jgi:hypothetical protein